MPSSDHVVSQRQRPDHVHLQNATETPRADKDRRRGRLGVQVDTSSSSSSIFRPIISHLPLLPNVPSIGRLLPSSNRVEDHRAHRSSTFAVWQEADLSHGHGKRPVLLVSSTHHALEISAGPSSSLPDVPHVQELFQPPELIFDLPRIRYDDSTEKTSLAGIKGTDTLSESQNVISACLLSGGPLWDQHGPVAALCTVTRNRKAEPFLRLVIVSLRSGTALKSVDLGAGTMVSIAASDRAIVLAVSQPFPTLHILDPLTLAPLYPPIRDLPPSNRTSLPTFALNSRLLAYVTNTPPTNAGHDGLGSVITAKAPPRARPSTSDGNLDRTANAHASSSQAILASAVGIGGGVAKGVWAGIKYGAKAAQSARTGKLGSSAPAAAASEAAEAGMDAEGDAASEASETRSIEEVNQSRVSSTKNGGVWIKILDLCPRRSQPNSAPGRRRDSRAGWKSKTGSTASSVISLDGPVTLAHFRLPACRSLPTSPAHFRSTSRVPIGHISFSPQGTHLLAAQEEGRAAHVLEIHPFGLSRNRIDSEIRGCVWHTHELRRGNTLADICDIQWDKTERWVGIVTGRGTTHIFPLNLGGPPADAQSHASLAPQNSAHPRSLHTVVTSAARLHSPSVSQQTEALETDIGIPYFGKIRVHPLDKKTLLDLTIYRPRTNHLQLARLVITKRQKPTKDLSSVNNGKRASGLTEMMRASYGRMATDLSVKGESVAHWALPSGSAGDEDELLMASKVKTSRPRLLPPVSSLARAEIQTHTMTSRVLPKSIYLSHQMDFFSARSIDEYSPLSILDPEARTGRLMFREEVEAHAAAEPGSPEIKSFDEPLMTALHSIMDSPPDTQLPGLPNGNRKYWQSATIPIRHVASGLGEGVGKVRREYVRAQHIRQKRRASEAAANKLSFEADVVLPPPVSQLSGSAVDDAPLSPDQQGLDVNGSGSSPSSGAPSHSTDSSNDTPLEGWTEEWDEEYAKAVEDDGAPEELVLGLMDEEQEERRKWMEKREDMKREWSRRV